MPIYKQARPQQGITLVELMVAMSLGLVITAGVISIYVQGGRAAFQDDTYARLQENGRFAMLEMAEDLKMTDFWGEMIDPAGIITALAAGEDCDINLLDGATAIQYNNSSSTTTSSNFDETADGCPALMGAIRANTDILAIKRVSGATTATPVDNVLYLRSNGVIGSLVNDAATTAPTVGFQDWLYLPRIYYIRNDAVPALCRMNITNLAFTAVPADGCIAEGIEQFHIQFGIDTDIDGVANQYIANPTAAQIDTAVSARLYVLARSAVGDRTYNNTKTYNLGDVVVGPVNDNFYRRVYSTTVTLRNPANLIFFN